MGRIIAAIVLLASPFSAHAQIAPPTAPGDDRLPGTFDTHVRPAEPAIGSELRAARKGIDRGRKNGDLSKREARALRREANQIDTLADRYGQDGLSNAEHRELEMRARVLQSQTESQRLRQSPNHR